MPTYREMISAEMAKHGESFADVVRINVHAQNQETWNYEPDDAALDVNVDTGYGCVEGPRVTAWTKRRVYFGAQYDGSEWIESVPRDPCDECIAHVGS